MGPFDISEVLLGATLLLRYCWMSAIDTASILHQYKVGLPDKKLSKLGSSGVAVAVS
jgi:hypothetical protein